MLDFRIETLSIGVTMTIGEYAIVDKLANFLIHHPEINMHLLISLDDFKMQHDFNIIWKSIVSIPINIFPFVRNLFRKELYIISLPLQ